MGWICCGGSGSAGRPGRRGTGRPGRRPAISAGRCHRGQAGPAALEGSRQEQAVVPSGKAHAPSVRAHCETVLCSFYDYHLEAGTGPLINPFPLDRSRRGGRANAHHNPMKPFRKERTGLHRPRVPSRVPRSVPDEEFNEIFARLPSHRDRAMVAFWSPRAPAPRSCCRSPRAGRPGTAADHRDPEGQRRAAGAPGFRGRVRVAAALPGRDGGPDPAGRRQPLWWTLRGRPGH